MAGLVCKLGKMMNMRDDYEQMNYDTWVESKSIIWNRSPTQTMFKFSDEYFEYIFEHRISSTTLALNPKYLELDKQKVNDYYGFDHHTPRMKHSSKLSN